MLPAKSTQVFTGRDGGAIIITFSLMLMFLIGFAAIAVDFGRLFIVRTELQTALDSCALAAAQELDGQTTSITRATNAGITAGNLNNVNLQSANWDGQPKLAAGDISFKDTNYTATTNAVNARYVQCQHTQSGIRTWLLPTLVAVSGNTLSSPNAVGGFAVATRGNAQSTCPIPVGLRAINNTPPDYGFLIGQWVTIVGKSTGAAPGEMGWYNLDGSTSASETSNELSEGGVCGVKIGDVLGTPGIQNSVDTMWNRRFGIYKNNDGPATSHPDLTGYAYTSTNWTNPPPQQNAYNGTPAAGSDSTAANFLTKRANFASFDDTGTSLTDGSKITYGVPNKLNSFQSIASPGSAGDHATYGYTRRLVVVPVLTTSSAVADFACMLMLAPMTGPNDDVQMEYRGNASSASSPCTTNGIAGGSAGPLVPVLVR
jgi:Flp pilus assembly protein TadG